MKDEIEIIRDERWRKHLLENCTKVGEPQYIHCGDNLVLGELSGDGTVKILWAKITKEEYTS